MASPQEHARQEYDRYLARYHGMKEPLKFEDWLLEHRGHPIRRLLPRTVESLKADPVEHPSHYTSHPSGVECIQITRHMGFNLGNAIKYIWRADLKGDSIEDLKKAEWYIRDEIAKREAETAKADPLQAGPPSR